MKQIGIGLSVLLFVVLSVWASQNFSPQKQNSGTKFSDNITTTPRQIARRLTKTNTITMPADSVLVKRVVDGDTIELESGEKVRYIGINTPETVDARKPVQCFGKEASEYNKNLVEGEAVNLVKDISNVDRYGRLLRYVYLKNGIFVNLKLVQEGYAYAATFPPDVRYSQLFKNAAAEAESNKRGLWAACKN